MKSNTASLLGCSLAVGARAATVPWASLNATLNGRLQTTKPLAIPCFSLYDGQPNELEDSAACAAVRESYSQNFLRTGEFESFYNIQSEMCVSDAEDQCVLDSSVSPAPMPPSGSSCNQGSVPSAYIEVESAADVVAALEFVREKDIPLSVKNSGHDYMVRNSGKGTLGLWVHKLQDMTYHDSFVPEGCTANKGMAMTVAAGVNIDDALEFADKNKATILGPYSPTVPLSTGWVMGGGHSILSPVYGLGADRVFEIRIVTPDGVERIANECQNTDLFWALRGGGGGTFGVVLSATHKVEPRMPIAFADVRLPSNCTSEDSLSWVAVLLEHSLEWGQTGWGGHVGGTFVTHVNPLPAFTTDGGVAAAAAFKKETDFALAMGGTSDIQIFPSFLAIWRKLYPTPQTMAASGKVTLMSTRLMPYENFATPENRDDIIAYMRRAQALGFDPKGFYTTVDTPFVYKGLVNGKNLSVAAESGETSMTQAWYGALWNFGTGGGFAWNSTYDERLDFVTSLTNVTKQTEQLAPGAGSYLNEANPFTPDWQESWWGDNYARLLEIKKKYDPDSLLKCWKCVGFDEEAEMMSSRFGCNGKLQMDVNKALL